jgi:hypothetical protein
MKTDHIVIGFLIAVILVVLIVNHRQPKRKLRWLDCNTTFDSILVTKPQRRGSFHIIDSLVLWSGYSPFDSTMCDTIAVKGLIWSPKKVLCAIGDLDVPFVVYKPTPTDTLHVIKDNITLYFRVPCDMQGRPYGSPGSAAKHRNPGSHGTSFKKKSRRDDLKM